MMTDGDLRTLARTLFDQGVRAADPAAAVTAALTQRPLPRLRRGRHFVIAVGKAACAMAEAALAVLPGSDAIALAVTNHENLRDVPNCRVLGAGHPVPDQHGLQAGRMVVDLLTKAGPEDHVLCLISGGGSALLPAPLPGLTLADKIRVNELMLAGGLDITETNLVRQQLSALKGGGMARLAAPATVRTLAVSDVIGDDPRTIASGPTATRLGTAREAVDILHEHAIWKDLPVAVKHTLKQETSDPVPPTEIGDISIICSNRHSLEAMLRSAPDWTPRIVSAELSGDVGAAARDIARTVRETPSGKPSLLIWGGETTVTLKGSGRGGRNQELALRLAMEAEDLPGNWVFLAGGTDGRDGPTDAAGGLVDAGTSQRVRDAGMTPRTLLDNNDSYAALQAAGDLLITGPTGTNVADLAVFLRR